MSKHKNDKNKDKKIEKRIKFLKIAKIFIIVCIGIVIIELIAMYLIKLNKESKITYIDTYNSIFKGDDYYIVTGSSNFKYSNYNNILLYEYEDDKDKVNHIYAEQAKLVKLDKELNVVFEKTFKCDYDSTYYDAITSNNAIYAVGSYVYEKKQISLKTRDGLLVKYDLDGNIVWSKNYQVLGDTKFKKIIEVEDGLIVIGQSIYENMEIGNHPDGGGIIIKYDLDGNIIWTNNFGGNKSGIFNDIVQVEDGYIVVGRDALNYGMIVKFSLTGDRLWVKNYSNTDEIGMTAIKLKDDKLYIAGAYNKSSEKTEDGKDIFEYDACIFVYDLNGNFIELYSIGGNKNDRFNSLILENNSIIAVGYSLSEDIDINNLNYQKDKSEGIVVEFNYEGKIINKKTYSGSKNETLSDIVESFDEKENLINNTKYYVVVGYTNSKRGLLKGNNKDYFSKAIKYDNKLELIYEK